MVYEEYLRRFMPFTTRKRLAESLVLSRINYYNVVYGKMPNYLVKWLRGKQVKLFSEFKTVVQDMLLPMLLMSLI